MTTLDKTLDDVLWSNTTDPKQFVTMKLTIIFSCEPPSLKTCSRMTSLWCHHGYLARLLLNKWMLNEVWWDRVIVASALHMGFVDKKKNIGALILRETCWSIITWARLQHEVRSSTRDGKQTAGATRTARNKCSICIRIFSHHYFLSQ